MFLTFVMIENSNQYKILQFFIVCVCFACANITLLLPIYFQALPGFLEQRKVGFVVPCPPSSGTVTLNTTTQNLTLGPGLHGGHLRKTLQSLSASMASNPVPPLTMGCLNPFVFNPFLRLFLSYFWLVSTFPWWRPNHSQYLTLQGFSRPLQQVSSKSLFTH